MDVRPHEASRGTYLRAGRFITFNCHCIFDIASVNSVMSDETSQ